MLSGATCTLTETWDEADTDLQLQWSTLGYGKAELEAENRRLKAQLRHLQRLVYLDPLTELGNRRYFDRAFAAELRRAIRDSTPLTLLVVDIDHFKAFNDTRGHATGDAVLTAVGSLLMRCCRRGGDFAARLGGDEFALNLSAMDTEAASAQIERIQYNVALLEPTPGGRRITLSCGAATFLGCGRPSVADIMNAADRALYRAKRAGRNAFAQTAVA